MAMPIFQVTPTELKSVAQTTFGAEGLMGRDDLQRLIREQISLLDARLMVIGFEPFHGCIWTPVGCLGQEVRTVLWASNRISSESRDNQGR